MKEFAGLDLNLLELFLESRYCMMRDNFATAGRKKEETGGGRES
jgi:hypothetical protein